jgi:hypothetical protein
MATRRIFKPLLSQGSRPTLVIVAKEVTVEKEVITKAPTKTQVTHTLTYLEPSPVYLKYCINIRQEIGTDIVMSHTHTSVKFQSVLLGSDGQ